VWLIFWTSLQVECEPWVTHYSILFIDKL
jgi:hypothetical protein